MADGKTPYKAYDLAIEESLANGYLPDIWSQRECVDVFRNTYSVDDEIRQEGREEGREEKAMESVVEMLKDGMDILLVAKYSKMSVEWVQNIQAGMQKELVTA